MNQDVELAVDHPSKLSPMNSREQALLATYDFVKHMSTLTIVAIGGMLGLAQGLGTKIGTKILLSVALMGLCGFLSLMFLASIALTQTMQRVHKSSNILASIIVVLVLMLFSASVFVFVEAFLHGAGH